MPYSRLDQIYRSLLMTKFFSRGWGKPENLKRLFQFKKYVANRESCLKLVPKDYPITITKEEICSDCKIIEGQFLSPLSVHLPGLMPVEAETAYFQIILPKKWSSDHYKPICLHLAGTGDHGFWRRRQLMAKPLLKKSGIGAILLENPFYGLRKPKDQVRSNLHNVSDIFVMGGCLILESLALFHWCERVGLGPLGITGMSMGGHMASLAATNWPKPIALVPCLSWSTASLVFTEGVMSGAIDWAMLEEQYFSNDIYQKEIRKMVHIDESAYQAGQHFAKTYPKSMDRFMELDKDQRAEKNVRNPADTYKVSTKQVERSTVKSTACTQVVTQSATEAVVISATVTKSNTDTSDSVTNTYGSSSTVGVTSVKKSGLFSLKTMGEKSTSLVSHFNKSKSRLLSRGDKSKSSLMSKDSMAAKLREREALQFMRGIMDECTHLRNFEVPVDTSLIIAICARNDAYVPREGCTGLTDIWPGAEVRYLDSGHVGAFIMHQKIFRAAIIESFDKMKKKYPHESRA